MASGLIEVRFDERKFRAVQRQLAGIPNGMRQVMPPAINRTATTARAKTARKLAGQIRVKVSQVKKGISIIKAMRDYWQATLRITTRRIPLIQFGARQTRRGTSYQIDKRAGRKTIKGAFIQTMPITGASQKHGHRGVFKREGKERLPIRELFGPSLGFVFEESGQIAAETMAETAVDLEKNVDSKVQWILSKYGRAG